MTVINPFDCFGSVISVNVALVMFAYIGQFYHRAEENGSSRVPEHGLVFKLIWLTVLYMILGATLKCRAAHHRKIRRWQNSSHDANYGSRLRMYPKELIRCEAKMTPVRHPMFLKVWDSFCCVVVWILFLRPVTLVYLLNSMIYMMIHLLKLIYDEHFIKDTQTLLYNGRHYSRLIDGICYSILEDENQNILYYPSFDLYGLPPPWARGV